MPYEERRVRVRDYGPLRRGSSLLVDVPTAAGYAQQRIHVLAAHALGHMAESAATDLGVALLVASGWREHRWESREEYERTLIARYGSVAEGRQWLAYDSPHETGLALDFGAGGLAPDRSTMDTQRQTAIHRWLVVHAWEYGWHPYLPEPWHWEWPCPREAWRRGRLLP